MIVKPRNPNYLTLLKKKGGAHGKSNKAKRRQETVKFNKEFCHA